MNKQRLAVAILAGIGMLGTFMPWVNVPIMGSINGTQYDGSGWLTLGIFAIPLAISLMGDRTTAIPKPNVYGVSVAGGLLAAFVIFKIVRFHSAMNQLSDGMESNPFASALGSSVSIGFGLYLIALAGAAVAAAPYVVKDNAPAPPVIDQEPV